MTLAERIHAARTHAKLTQAELARRVGMKQQMLTKLESGKALATSKLAELSIECGVSTLWLARGEGPMVAVNVAEVLSPREQALLENYRASNDPGKRAIERTALAIAEPPAPSYLNGILKAS